MKGAGKDAVGTKWGVQGEIKEVQRGLRKEVCGTVQGEPLRHMPI